MKGKHTSISQLPGRFIKMWGGLALHCISGWPRQTLQTVSRLPPPTHLRKDAALG